VNLVDIYTITISVRGVDVLALKKLALVNHALAEKIDGYTAKEEQKMLVSVLDDLVRQIEINAALAR
jgi:hypothetical protein